MQNQAAAANASGNSQNAFDAMMQMQRQASSESLNAQRRDTTKEETAEALLEKLQKKGKNVKIVSEEEE